MTTRKKAGMTVAQEGHYYENSNQIYHALRSSSEIMDSEVTGIALFFEGRNPEKIVLFLLPRNP